MDYPKFIVSYEKEDSISIQRVRIPLTSDYEHEMSHSQTYLLVSSKKFMLGITVFEMGVGSVGKVLD